MSNRERSGIRDLTYSAWHRVANLKQWLGEKLANFVTMVDIDSLEYCKCCYEPLALIETKFIEAVEKSWTATAKLALRAGIPAYLVIYDKPDGLVTKFWVTGSGYDHHPMTPDEYAWWLVGIHANCNCQTSVQYLRSCNERP